MKALLLYASLGAGHKRAAQALEESFAEHQVETDLKDLLQFLPRPAAYFYSSAYSFMITKARPLWRFVYETTNRPKSLYAPAVSPTQRWQFGKLKEYVRRGQFDFIVSTHFTPSALLADWRKENVMQAGIVSVVTDHVAHRCWKRDGLDHYFVPSQEVACQLHESGIPQGKITVSGIPISAAFSQPMERLEARKRWECNPEDMVALVLCSGLNTPGAIRVLEEVRDSADGLRLLVSAGADSRKQRALEDFFRDESRWKVVGFSPKIAEMMKAADFIVTKPGGLIVSEALASALPQILLSPIPGQEEANAAYAVHHGAAVCVQESQPGAVRSEISQLLTTPRRLSEMSESAAKIGKPHAASAIVDQILRFVPS